MPPELVTKAIDAGSGFARRHLHGSAVHRWPLTNWVYRHLMHFAQGAHSGDADIEVTFRNCTFATSSSDITITPTLRDGTYEAAEIAAWLSLLREGDNVVDVGANIGVFTVLSAQQVGAQGTVTAFEPEPENARRLRGNVLRNDVPNVTIHEACAGDTKGTITLYIQPGQSGTHSAVRSQGAVPKSVPLETLDAAIATRPVAAMKIDVEGLEAAVLRGAQKIITTDKPAILLEFNGGDELRHLLEPLLKDYDYCAFISRRGQREITPGDLKSLDSVSGFGNILLANRR